jgi:hypothetical protein
MGMEDLSIDITYDPCYFSLDSTFNVSLSWYICPCIALSLVSLALYPCPCISII